MSRFAPSSNPAPALPVPDLTVFTEATRRALYDLVAAILFAPLAFAYDDPSEPPTPPDDPDGACLVVFSAYARWFAVWSLPPPPCRTPPAPPFAAPSGATQPRPSPRPPSSRSSTRRV